jgi:heme-degrading monooxygenase HmoA
MILEIAILPIKPDKTERMEELGRDVASHLAQGKTPGFHSFRLVRAIEDPNRFVLHLTWDRVEDHTALGESEYGQEVTVVIQECLADEPVVHHYEVVDGARTGDISL